VATTLSVGVVLREAGETSDALIARADRAMYAAKRAGRDQTVVSPLV
jgi:PleD family two-component response regulator